jgi:subtilisin family serine protease
MFFLRGQSSGFLRLAPLALVLGLVFRMSPVEASNVLSHELESPQFVPHEYLVKVKSRRSLEMLTGEFDVAVSNHPIITTANGDWYKLTDVESRTSFSEIMAFAYSNHLLNDEILHIEKNLIWRSLTVAVDPAPRAAPSLPKRARKDPMLGRSWGITKVHSPEAWLKTLGSEQVIVADIDTGIDYNHDDLINNVWRNSKEIPGDGIDNDANGFVDDVVGWDFVNKDSLPWDDNGHGTHTSGSIAATGGNGIGTSGVAPRVRLMGLKFLSGDGSGSTEDAVRAINYAVQSGASVLSNSWGGDEYSKALEDAISEAAARNVLFVAAAGNDGTNNDTLPMYPAAYNLPNVIAVAASDSEDRLVDYSNYGANSVHIVAPGDVVFSTVPGNKYEVNSGTSMACPHVAGAAALLKSFKPTLSAVEIKRILLASVDKDPEYADKISSGGRLNVERALSLAAGDQK